MATDLADHPPDAASARPCSSVTTGSSVGPRPVFLNLMRIQMPVGALTSIGHRISGVVLAASVPVAVYLLGLSLRDAVGFSQVIALFAQFPVKALAVIVVWALAQHSLSGVRHLLTDFDIGSPMRVARRSAWFVNLAGVAVAALAAGCWRRLNLDRPGGAAKNLDQLSSDSQAPAVPGGAAEAE